MILLLAGCIWRADGPVPSHGTHDAVRAALVDENPSALAAAITSWTVTASSVGAADRDAWARLHQQAVALREADVRSKRATAYGRFVASCSACHAGEPVANPPVAGHGQALIALEEAVIHDNPDRAAMAVNAMAGSPDLPGVVKRFTQLANKTAGALDDRARAAHYLSLLYSECVRCHGPASPMKLVEP